MLAGKITSLLEANVHKNQRLVPTVEALNTAEFRYEDFRHKSSESPELQLDLQLENIRREEEITLASRFTTERLITMRDRNAILFQQEKFTLNSPNFYRAMEIAEEVENIAKR